MTLRRWKHVSESTVVKNPWWTYKRDNVELPSGKASEYHYVHTNGSSMVIPILEGGAIIMVRQYRYLCRKDSLEFPCGSVKDGSSYDETAHHELVEETGFAAKRLSIVGKFNPYNGITDEMCHVYIARELQNVSGNPDETEEFELVHLEPEDIEEAIRGGGIWDGMSMAAWMIAKSLVI